MLVIDASVLVTVVAHDAALGERARARLRGQTLAAPEVVDLECLSVLRRLVAAGRVTDSRAALAAEQLHEWPILRASHTPLLPRVWSLRENVSAYDAAYVALAESLDAILLTADQRLARAPGPTCEVEVFR